MNGCRTPSSGSTTGLIGLFLLTVFLLPTAGVVILGLLTPFLITGLLLAAAVSAFIPRRRRPRP